MSCTRILTAALFIIVKNGNELISIHKRLAEQTVYNVIDNGIQLTNKKEQMVDICNSSDESQNNMLSN